MIRKVMSSISFRYQKYKNGSLGLPNPKDSDIYLVSYPKSGNTWLRYLMAQAIWPELEAPDLKKLASYIPSYGLPEDIAKLKDPDAPCNKLRHRLIKHHTSNNIAAQRFMKKAIYLIRDGRDALVSYWHFCNQRDGVSTSLEDFLVASAIDPRYYGPWQSHVNGWVQTQSGQVLLLRYEELLLEPSNTLDRALRFSGFDISPDLIARAVAKSSFESMRSIERDKGLGLKGLERVNFVRVGKSGGWRDVFSHSAIEIFKRYHGSSIEQLGYSW